MKTTRLLYRFLFFIFYTTGIVLEIHLRRLLTRADMRACMRVRQRWARTLLRQVGLSIETRGIPPDFPCLIVCNHRSYVDPIVLLRDVFAFPVAKAELSSWPVIGKGAKLAGILYVKREHGGSRTGILKAMHSKISEGFQIILFPEGTTSGIPDGTLPFKKGGFILASKNNIPVVPVCLHFADRKDYWIGKQTFMAHALSRFGEKRIHLIVQYGPAFAHEDADSLLHDCREWINQQLRQPQLHPITSC